MEQPFENTNITDADGKPAGGHAEATGIRIAWQDGPLGRVGSEQRVEPNGAFVETVIAIARSRILYYQDAGFACDENAEAIGHLEDALGALNRRTARRAAAGVEGTHEGN